MAAVEVKLYCIVKDDHQKLCRDEVIFKFEGTAAQLSAFDLGKALQQAVAIAEAKWLKLKGIHVTYKLELVSPATGKISWILCSDAGSAPTRKNADSQGLLVMLDEINLKLADLKKSVEQQKGSAACVIM